MRPVGNALELKLCKIPILGTQSENQTLPQYQPRKPNRFSVWALHLIFKKRDFGYFILDPLS
ncbi:hypothetical protein C2R79_04460 [Helicobacter pylori]|nr:hypothetical protein [Helicobacter pylori]PUD13594.1 hypothetical protein C2R79_04460 [Helicobacter pylori]